MKNKSTKISKLRKPTPDGQIGTVTLGADRPPTSDHAAIVWGTRYGDCDHTAVAIGGGQYAIYGTMPAPRATTRTTHLIVRLTAAEKAMLAAAAAAAGQTPSEWVRYQIRLAEC